MDVALLMDRIAEGGAPLAVEFVAWRGDREDCVCWTRDARADAAARAAGAIASATEPGDRVIVAAPPGPGFLASFLGCLWAGRIAVPAPTPTTERSRESVDRLRNATGARLVLTAAPESEPIAPVAPAPDVIAYLQFTSGSTQAPRGAVITHGALAANLAAIGDAWRLTSADRGVFWLPPFHDMGLVGALLAPIAFGFPATLFHPAAFLQKPSRWLDLMSSRRATFSGAPNFAYDLCVDRAGPSGRDLANWRVAVNGAEPVSASTLARFAARFTADGFRAAAFSPGYGLAEAVLFVSARRSDSRSPAADPAEPVCCGRPGRDIAVRIVDETRATALDEGQTGAIWVGGPSLAAGYWNHRDGAFGATLQNEPQTFLRTGDIGFMRDGELYVCGRAKDVLIRAGRKLHAADMERAIATRAGGRSAVFSVAGSPERIVVVHEPALPSPEARTAIVDALGAGFDVVADDIVLAPPGAIRLTTSGKIARAATRDAYLSRTLHRDFAR